IRTGPGNPRTFSQRNYPINVQRMNKWNQRAAILMLCCASLPRISQGQDSLLNQLDSITADRYGQVIATFKASRIINGQSIEGAGKGELQFVVSHRFGQVNHGIETFFGLDDANTMLSLEYGITDKVQVALQRSSFNKMVDGFVKYRFLSQTEDERT